MVKGASAKADREEKAKLTPEERLKKVSKTVGWFNKHGGLQSEIFYKKSGLAKVDARSALKILKELEEKAGDIKNPTNWIRKATERVPDLKIRKTIAWFNQHGNLAEPIKYDDVKGALATIRTRDALQILKDMENTEVKKPTAWILAAAGRKEPWVPAHSAKSGGSWEGGWNKKAASWETEECDKKVRKVIGWYNKSGNLQQPLNYSEAAPLLAQVGTGVALEILKSLDGKEAEIRDPTAYICAAARKRL